MMLVGLLALLGLVNFLLRYAFIGLLGERPLPDWLRLGLRFVPLAILTALITPDVLLPGGERRQTMRTTGQTGEHDSFTDRTVCNQTCPNCPAVKVKTV